MTNMGTNCAGSDLRYSKLLKALKLLNKSVAYDFRKIRPKRSGDAGMEHFIGNEAVQGGEHHLDMVGVTSTS
jgi:hypothetical protein